MTSKLEINVRSLISHCEELSKDTSNNWRLKKYIKSLDTMINELEESNERPNSLASTEYRVRISTLKSTVNYVESPANPTKFKSHISDKTGESVIREVNQLHKSKYQNDMRTELLGIDGAGIGGLRKRGPNAQDQSEDMGEAFKHYSNIQEKLAEDMLILTRNLKEQTQAANIIIKRDTEVVKKSTLYTDKNISNLGKESDTLQGHSNKACKCWLWLIFALVIIIFMYMIIFMRFVKKKTY